MDAPRQDILETRVERALSVYRERFVSLQLFPQWTLKSSFEDKSFFFLALSTPGKSEGARSRTKVKLDLFIFPTSQSLSEPLRQSGSDTGV